MTRARLRSLLLLLGATAAGLASGVNIVAARLVVDPPRPYVNQPFTLTLELETTPGCQMQELTLEGLPGGDAIALPQLTTQPATPFTRDGDALERHLFTSVGRGLRPVSLTLKPAVGVTLVERRTRGFFSSWNSITRNLRLPPVPFAVLALPEAGRPADFAGAVGSFSLRGRLEPDEVMPDDLVTLSLELAGDGYLGEALPLLPPSSGLFRVYPPRREERPAAGVRLTLTQVLVPLSTNAVQFGVVRFPYFDPGAGAYREAAAGPFALRFTTRAAEPHAVRRLAPAAPDRREGPLPSELADTLQSEGRRLLPFAAGLAAALLGAAALRPYRPRWTLPVAVLLFAAATAAAWRLLPQRAPAACLREPATLRLAPALSSLPLAELPAGLPVHALEQSRDWLRVEAAGRRGWLPAAAVAAAATDEPAPRVRP